MAASAAVEVDGIAYDVTAWRGGVPAVPHHGWVATPSPMPVRLEAAQLHMEPEDADKWLAGSVLAAGITPACVLPMSVGTAPQHLPWQANSACLPAEFDDQPLCNAQAPNPLAKKKLSAKQLESFRRFRQRKKEKTAAMKEAAARMQAELEVLEARNKEGSDICLEQLQRSMSKQLHLDDCTADSTGTPCASVTSDTPGRNPTAGTAASISTLANDAAWSLLTSSSRAQTGTGAVLRSSSGLSSALQELSAPPDECELQRHVDELLERYKVLLSGVGPLVVAADEVCAGEQVPQHITDQVAMLVREYYDWCQGWSVAHPLAMARLHTMNLETRKPRDANNPPPGFWKEVVRQLHRHTPPGLRLAGIQVIHFAGERTAKLVARRTELLQQLGELQAQEKRAGPAGNLAANTTASRCSADAAAQPHTSGSSGDRDLHLESTPSQELMQRADVVGTAADLAEEVQRLLAIEHSLDSADVLAAEREIEQERLQRQQPQQQRQ